MKKVLLLIIKNVMLNLFQHRNVVSLCASETSSRRRACFIVLIYILFITPKALAYQTVLVDFPENQGWHSVYYATQGNESILQYVPIGQSYENWTKTMVFHSYRNADGSENLSNNAGKFMDTTTSQMEYQNSSQLYKYTKYTNMDSIAVRCVQKNAYIPTQCEIYRVSNSYEGLITMHYINKNISDYKNSYNLWYEIMKDIRIYYSYYREDRILDKATSFEL